MEALAIIGALVLLPLVWWVVGVLMWTTTDVYVSPNTPFSSKAAAAWAAGWVMPYFLFTRGRLPVASYIMPENPSEEEVEGLRRWMHDKPCPCPNCKRERAE